MTTKRVMYLVEMYKAAEQSGLRRHVIRSVWKEGALDGLDAFSMMLGIGVELLVTEGDIGNAYAKALQRHETQAARHEIFGA
ncbi:MAG: hypothetical protein C7B46_01240 [Sulfobacillus benefaciens]|uniref:Uncharacterized protein n=1 Tax=Sulfobacillus benefaciens TaxID=453960 RepID=A0A2T2XLF8_9FIRM|nr:MAG: hypothetical protein C7B46_01240 [Sulfobacillus benefaciens]